MRWIGECRRAPSDSAPLVAAGADPRQDVAGVRKALFRVRRDVMDLSVAKSTFFALADTDGTAIRNDLEEDVMAGQNLFKVFPSLTKAKGAYVTTTGALLRMDRARQGTG